MLNTTNTPKFSKRFMQNVIKVYYKDSRAAKENQSPPHTLAKPKQPLAMQTPATQIPATVNSKLTSRTRSIFNNSALTEKREKEKETFRTDKNSAILQLMKKLQAKNKAVITIKEIIVQSIRTHFRQIMSYEPNPLMEHINFTNLLLNCAENVVDSLARGKPDAMITEIKLNENYKRSSISVKSSHVSKGNTISNVSTIKGMSICSYEDKPTDISKQENRFNPLLSTFSSEDPTVSQKTTQNSFYEPKTHRYEAYSPKKSTLKNTKQEPDFSKSGNVSLVEFAHDDSICASINDTRYKMQSNPPSEGTFSMKDVEATSNPALLSQSRDKRNACKMSESISSKYSTCSKKQSNIKRQSKVKKSTSIIIDDASNGNVEDTTTHRTITSSKDRLLTAHFKE